MLFDRLPIPARKDPRLSAASIILLAAIVPKGGPWPEWVELADELLQEETGQSRSALHRHFKQLEEAGWIMRIRRRGHRKIFLLFDLAGSKRAPDLGHACPTSGKCAPQLRVMHAPDPGPQEIREAETKIPKGSPSATRPLEGASPTTTPNIKPEATEAEPINWAKLAAEAGPGNPFAKLARKYAERENTSAPGSPDRSPGADDEGQSPCIKDFTANTESGQDK